MRLSRAVRVVVQQKGRETPEVAGVKPMATVATAELPDMTLVLAGKARWA